MRLLGVHERGAPDQHVALDQAAPSDLLAQAQVAEIGRRGIDQDGLQIGACQRNLLKAFHLRHQLGNVLQTRFADLIAQGQQLFVVAGPRLDPGAVRRGGPSA